MCNSTPVPKGQPPLTEQPVVESLEGFGGRIQRDETVSRSDSAKPKAEKKTVEKKSEDKRDKSKNKSVDENQGPPDVGEEDRNQPEQQETSPVPTTQQVPQTQFSCEATNNLYCNLFSEKDDGCPKGFECCRGKCVPGPGCGCCGGCLFGGCENLKDPNSVCYQQGMRTTTTMAANSKQDSPQVFDRMSPARQCNSYQPCPESYKCMSGECGRLVQLKKCKNDGECPYGISCSSDGLCMPSERKHLLESDRSIMSDREREEEELERLFGNVFDLEDIAMAADNDL